MKRVYVEDLWPGDRFCLIRMCESSEWRVVSLNSVGDGCTSILAEDEGGGSWCVVMADDEEVWRV